MQKNIQKNPSLPWEGPAKPSTVNSIKSQKVLKLLTVDTEACKPFRRKQEQITVNKKNQYEDIGKLISNTSFGSNPDIKKIVSTSPKHCFENKFPEEESKEDRRNKAMLRESKSFTDLQKVTELYKVSSAKLLGSVENLYSGRADEKNSIINGQLRQKNTEFENLKIKMKELTLEKKQLSEKYLCLQKKLDEIQLQISQKQNLISQHSMELHRKIQENEQQKQIIKCLEDIIIQLNGKIDQLMQRQEEEIRERESHVKRAGKQQLEAEVEELKEKVYSLHRTIVGLQVQTIIMKKLKQELEKQKQSNKCLEKENKGLKQRILNLMKVNRVKPAKLSLKQDLDYSVSFEFQH